MYDFTLVGKVWECSPWFLSLWSRPEMSQSIYCSEEWGKVSITQKEGSPMSGLLSAKRRSEEARNQQLTSLLCLILAKVFLHKWEAAGYPLNVHNIAHSAFHSVGIIFNIEILWGNFQNGTVFQRRWVFIDVRRSCKCLVVLEIRLLLWDPMQI